MAFGPIMRMNVGDLEVELAPIVKADAPLFIRPGMQQASVTKYLSFRTAPVEQDEEEWFETTRQDSTSVVWGIYVLEDGHRKLIGNTALNSIKLGHTHQATSGFIIFDKAYWGKGIASTTHKARTWYAFTQLGLTRIKSAVVHGNIASRKALEKSGYALVYVERNTTFVDGALHHQDNLECLNPSDSAWRIWWGAERPTARSRAARVAAKEALAWAERNVRLS